MIPRTHPLAGVREAYNAVFVEAEAAGQLMFYGRGAGGAPTASAVLGDLVAVGRNRLSGGRGPRESAYADLPVRPIGRGGDPLPRQPRRRRQGRVCSPRWRRPSPSTTCRSRRVRQDGRRATTPPSSSSPTAPPTPPSAAWSRSCAALDVVRAVASVHAGGGRRA